MVIYVILIPVALIGAALDFRGILFFVALALAVAVYTFVSRSPRRASGDRPPPPVPAWVAVIQVAVVGAAAVAVASSLEERYWGLAILAAVAIVDLTDRAWRALAR